MRGKAPRRSASTRPSSAPTLTTISVTGMRREALENFAGSIAHVTAIARGECFVTLKERCAACGAQPDVPLDPSRLLKLVPRPSEITQANALLAKISLPAQSENLNRAEGVELMEAMLGHFHRSAIAYGVPLDIVKKWHSDALAASALR